MSPSGREYLQHILDETTYIMTSSIGLDKAAFVQNETLKRAYVRSIEVIGEAVKQLPDELRQKYSAIEWRAMAGMRDRFIANLDLKPNYRRLKLSGVLNYKFLQPGV